MPPRADLRPLDPIAYRCWMISALGRRRSPAERPRWVRSRPSRLLASNVRSPTNTGHGGNGHRGRLRAESGGPLLNGAAGRNAVPDRGPSGRSRSSRTRPSTALGRGRHHAPQAALRGTPRRRATTPGQRGRGGGTASTTVEFPANGVASGMLWRWLGGCGATATSRRGARGLCRRRVASG